MKTILASIALALLPVAALADCPWKDKTAMSCPQGQAWDGHAKACVVQSS